MILITAECRSWRRSSLGWKEMLSTAQTIKSLENTFAHSGRPLTPRSILKCDNIIGSWEDDLDPRRDVREKSRRCLRAREPAQRGEWWIGNPTTFFADVQSDPHFLAAANFAFEFRQRRSI